MEMALIRTVLLVATLLLPRGNNACSGSCNCTVQAPDVLAAWCRMGNWSELGRFIERPQDVRVLHLQTTNSWEWNGKVHINLTSLEVLNIAGNTTWDIPEHILELPKLREINGVDMNSECSACSLVKDSNNAQKLSGFLYVQNQGYQFRNKCVEQDIIFHRKYVHFLNHRFFPRCVLADEGCRSEFATLHSRNRCFELGAPILLASTVIALLALTANIFVVVAVACKIELRTKPSMMLAGSLAAGDIVYSFYAVMIGISYQVVAPENFQSKADQICPYMAFMVVTSFAFASHISFLITLEKYLVIVYGLKPHLRMRTKTTLRCILVAGLSALVQGILLILMPDIPRDNINCLPMFGRETVTSTIFSWTIMSIHTLEYIGAIALYARIFVVARKSGNRMGIHREGQLVKSIGLVVGTNFLLGFLPLVFVFVASPLEGRGVINYDQWIVFCLTLPIALTALNSLIDPFLYIYRNPQFKNIVKRKWDQIKPKKTPKKDTDKQRSDMSEAVVITNIRRISVS